MCFGVALTKNNATLASLHCNSVNTISIFCCVLSFSFYKFCVIVFLKTMNKYSSGFSITVTSFFYLVTLMVCSQVIVFEGLPSVSTKANTPQSLLGGMNKFLEQLKITFRRDPNNYRPRINKLNSVKDCEQKNSGNFFFLED